MSLSLKDIIECGKIAYKIYDRCFTRANGADLRYLDFGRQVNELGNSLRTLENVIDNAQRQTSSLRRPWDNEANRYDLSWQVLPQVAGDFKQTLHECDNLLNDRSKFRYSRAGFIENVIWWASVEGDVNTLKERVRFHMMKLTFVAKPFEWQLLAGIKRELQELRVDFNELRYFLIHGPQDQDSSSSIYLRSFEAPSELANRFADALQNNKPASFHNQADIPLKEGFDALVHHFANSTILFNPQPELGQRDPEEPQYLNLVKCGWMTQVIRQSASFQSASSDSLWAHYMRELEDDIRRQFGRFDNGQLVRPLSDRILLLPESCFSIWFVERPPIRAPGPAEQRPLEEKILELNLPSTIDTLKSTLTVFRKSESKLRLVTTNKDTQNQYFHQEEGTNVNLEANRLIPTYATPGDVSTLTSNVMICSNEGQDEVWYSLKDLRDVLDFQRALTGFFVSCDMLNVSWSHEGSSKSNNFGRGRLQFWYLKPFEPIGEDGNRRPSDRSSSISTTLSPNHSAARKRQWTGESTSPTLLSAGTSVPTGNGSKGSGTALIRPEIPRIILFTKCERQYVLLQLKLYSSVFVNPRKTKSSTSVVIDSRSKKLQFQKLCVEELQSWNLSCFRHPVHPEMRHLENPGENSEMASRVLETISKKYLVLTFSTEADKTTFCTEFTALERLRDVNENDYTRTLMIERYRANNPGSSDGVL